MKENERAPIEAKLLEERERILASLETLRLQAEEATGRAAGELSNYPLHLADQATGALEREQALAVAEQESRYLASIEEALERLYRDPDSYGVCQSCGREIAAERLAAVPHTRFCIECQAAQEESE